MRKFTQINEKKNSNPLTSAIRKALKSIDGNRYKDLGWQGVKDAIKIIRNEADKLNQKAGEPKYDAIVTSNEDDHIRTQHPDFNIPQGGYKKDKDGSDIRKQYYIEVYENGTLTDVISLYMSAVGTVKDPYETYELNLG